MIANQAYLFLIFTLNGIVIGLLFDFFRILRRSFKTTDIITYIEDILFWIIAGLILLYSIFVFNNGEIRLFIFLGIFIGISIYILIFSNHVIKASVYIIKKTKNVVKNILKILIYPINIIIKILRKIVFKPVSFIIINIKKFTLSKSTINYNNILKNLKNFKFITKKEGIQK